MASLPKVAQLTVTDLFCKRVSMHPEAPAISGGERTLSYGELEQRVRQWAALLRQYGLTRGQRIVLWSENRIEYVEILLAGARLGVTVACLNWRLGGEEQLHCIRLVRPRLALVSERYRQAFSDMPHGVPQVIHLDAPAAAPAGLESGPFEDVDPEDGFLILYTSGTTGLPKGAVISQRATIARSQAFASQYGITSEDGFIAWSPFFHMAATDHALATLLLGGHVTVHDGFGAARICDVIERERIGWLMAMPGVIEQMIDELRSRPRRVLGVKMVGAMADLVPRQQLSELTALLGAPYLNTFGSTETGLAPASAALLPAGETSLDLSKREFGWCRVRLVDEQGRDVPDGVAGDILVRGPSMFSGYWDGDRLNDQELADGWFNMGDMFVRNPDGSLGFVDRSKYLIKSGGENVYPAEVERVLLSHPDVVEAVVVRRADERWGEVPVAFVAHRENAGLTEGSIVAYCRERLASYKIPKEVRFLKEEAFPRSSTGKIQKKQVEALL